jgi:LysR family glycine cleavage system transcriptional activator
MDRLPPLNALRAFEAAARHMSITLAADELHVTAGAVSRQIKSLEDVLGLQLFKRGHREISLTRQGGDYYRAVTRSLDALREATRRLTRSRQRKQLKIRAYTTFAMRWLIPRLSGFHAAHPDIEVLLKASLEPVDFRKEDIDGAIRLGDGNWPGSNTYRLVDNILTPVASPALLKSGPKLKKPADLARHTLLHSIARPDDWATWLEAAGVRTQIDAHAGMTYESSAMAYAAAIEGQGVAIAQRFLVAQDLQDGSLVQPFRKTVDMGDFTYYLLTPRHREESYHMKTFRLWLFDQFESRRGAETASG